MSSSEIFERVTFCEAKISLYWKDQQPWPDLALNQDFAEGRRLKPMVKKQKLLNLEICCVN